MKKMSKKQKADKRNRIRKLKYATVMNYMGDHKLAREARDWSNFRILQTYGLKVGKRTPKIKPLGKRAKANRRIELKKYLMALESGYSLDEAKEIKKETYSTIIAKAPENTLYKYKIKGRKNRRDVWADWSKQDMENMPTEVIDLAENINISKGYDPNAKYGFAVVFYSYTENDPLSFWIKQLKPDIFMEGDLYRNMKRLK